MPHGPERRGGWRDQPRNAKGQFCRKVKVVQVQKRGAPARAHPITVPQKPPISKRLRSGVLQNPNQLPNDRSILIDMLQHVSSRSSGSTCVVGQSPSPNASVYKKMWKEAGKAQKVKKSQGQAQEFARLVDLWSSVSNTTKCTDGEVREGSHVHVIVNSERHISTFMLSGHGELLVMWNCSVALLLVVVVMSYE